MFTPEQAASLAPDAGTLNRAKKLAKPNKFRNTGYSERALWGVALGSSNYTTLVDLQGPAYKCSCPVHKMPCKHALGLMLLLAQDPSAVTDQNPPEALIEWLNKRDGAAKSKQNRVAGEVKDTKAQTRRVAQRAKNVDQGISELKRFLEDTVRMGLAESAKRTEDTWEQIQKRLIDAQARGLARQITWLRSNIGRGADWIHTSLRAVVHLHALITAYEQRDHLPPELVDTLKERIGWAKLKEELQTGPSLDGTWLVLNHALFYESDLYTQTIWLMHRESAQFCQQLNFASSFNRETLPGGYQAGVLIEGQAYYYSQWLPQRAHFVRPSAFDHTPVEDWQWLQPYCQPDIRTAIRHLQTQRIKQPFNITWPLLLKDVRAVTIDEQLALADAHNHVLMLQSNYSRPWQLLSAMGKETVTVFGTTTQGMDILPWAVLGNDQWQALNLSVQDE